MHRIDTPDAVASLFVDGNPQTGQLATQVDFAWLNDLQETVCNVIEHTGVVLSKGTYNQLTNAIIAIATGVGGTGTVAGAVPTTRNVLTSGLATGGHALDADVTINVPKSTSALVSAGIDPASVVTPDLLGALFGIAANYTGGEVTMTLPGGFIVKLGNYGTAIAAEGQIAFNFGTAFPTACLFLFAMPINASASSLRDVWLQRVSISATGAVVYAQWDGQPSTTASLDGFDYIAVGR